ncbi:MAG: IS110 family transposase [Desulfovibrio sp.]|nr:IS110 family transposase [Desulfovibrio sp.]
MGHRVNLIKAERVKVFPGHRNKTDAADAQAICEALMHPGTTFVAVKSIDQQSLDFLFDRRERLVHDRTEIVNQTRAFLAELGLVMPKGIQHFDTHFRALISEHRKEFNNRIQSVLTENFSEYTALCERIDSVTRQIEAEATCSDDCRRLMQVSGFGPLIAVALCAAIGNGLQFKNGRHLSAYLGLVPGEYSSGGKQRLLGITKRGNRRLRTLLVLAANALMMGLSRRKKGDDGQPLRPLNAMELWVTKLVERVGRFKAKVALANKLARIAWALIAKGEDFNASKAVCLATA